MWVRKQMTVIHGIPASLNTARRKIAGKLLTHKEIDQKKYFVR
jgi:hypothetical protein